VLTNIEMTMTIYRPVRLRDVVRLVCLLISVAASVALTSAEALASPRASDGLAPGASIPAWAAGHRIHFLPAKPTTMNSSGTSRGVHNQLGRRCEAEYCPTSPTRRLL